jgi:hypothetical protein
MGPVEKEIRQFAAQLRKRMPEFDEHESLLYVHSLLATPDQRWERRRNYVRLRSFSEPSKKR